MSDGGFCHYCRKANCECPEESTLYRCLFCGHVQRSNAENCTPAICGAYAWQPITKNEKKSLARERDTQ